MSLNHYMLCKSYNFQGKGKSNSKFIIGLHFLEYKYRNATWNSLHGAIHIELDWDNRQTGGERPYVQGLSQAVPLFQVLFRTIPGSWLQQNVAFMWSAFETSATDTRPLSVSAMASLSKPRWALSTLSLVCAKPPCWWPGHLVLKGFHFSWQSDSLTLSTCKAPSTMPGT